jgi:hypothetical protein
MTLTTDVNGNTSGTTYGPYLQQAPKNPFTNSFSAVASGGAATDGWIYTQATGSISAIGFDEDTLTYTAPSGSSSSSTGTP